MERGRCIGGGVGGEKKRGRVGGVEAKGVESKRRWGRVGGGETV
jgi:hypothetical protein